MVVHISGVTAAAFAIPFWSVCPSGFTGMPLPSPASRSRAFGHRHAGLLGAIQHGRTAPLDGLLKRLDHSAIYTKIAGTYTPLGLMTGGHGTGLVAGLWLMALIGTLLKMIAPDRLRWAGLSLYILMGWAGVFAGGDIIAALSTPVLVLELIGGLIYTGGVALYLFDRLPFHYTLWHVCVLAATMVLYAAITVHLVQTAPAAGGRESVNGFLLEIPSH